MKLSDLKRADNIPGDSGNSLDHAPSWMDFDRFQRGKEFFFRHSSALFLAMHCSLATGLSIINLLLPLVFTQQSNTPEKAYKRYFQTFLHIALWHFGDVWQAPDGKAHKSIKLVRRMHNTVGGRMNKGKSGTNDDSGKLYFSQYDMALVQSGFFGAALMYPEGFGIKCTKEELGDYAYFWRGIGYLMGVDDKYNLCNGTFEEIYSLCKELERELLLPSLQNPPKDFPMMADAYVDGSNQRAKRRVMTKEALFAFTAEGMGLPFPKLSILDYLRYLYLKTIVFLTRWCPFFERMSNYFVKRMFYKELGNLKL